MSEPKSLVEEEVQKRLAAHRGNFWSEVLLSEPVFDREAFLRDLKECAFWVKDSDLEKIAAAMESDGSFETDVLGPRIFVRFEKEPQRELLEKSVFLPNFGSEGLGWFWDGAGKAVRSHRARLCVKAGHGSERPADNPYGIGVCFVAVTAALCRQAKATAVFRQGCLQEPDCWRREWQEAVEWRAWPVRNWVQIVSDEKEDGWHACTYGMESLGFEEMETAGGEDPAVVKKFLFACVLQTVARGRSWRSGDVLRLGSGDAHRLVRGPGKAAGGIVLQVEYGKGLPEDVVLTED